jgi:hypothetical protein
MNLTSQTELLVKDLLCNSGRLVRDQTITLEPMPGNPERRDYTTRRRFLVRTDTSSLAVLVVGKDLTQLRQKSELFSQAYPDLACSVFAHGNVDDHDLLLTDYFAGLTAGEALNDPSIGETGVLPALELLASRLNRAVKPSTSAAFAGEIETLQAKLLRIPHWTAADRTFLDHIVFPFAAKHFRACRSDAGHPTVISYSTTFYSIQQARCGSSIMNRPSSRIFTPRIG